MKLKGIFSTLAACALLTASVAANATIITVDNTDAGFTSSGFTNSHYAPGFNGINYMVDTSNVSGDFAIWDPTSSVDWLAGIWNVEMIWTDGANRASNAVVTIDSGSASSSLIVDQSINGSIWNDLGDFSFDLSGASVSLDDSNSNTNKFVIADAVRFTLVTAADSISAPTDVPAPSTLLVLLAAAAGIFRLRRK
tara:strand:+ start:210 stop:794 length:585 start_codon:yes stop_codon:yes gene_type:complete